MSSPLVSINLVVYNGEKYVRHCLDSIKDQTYQNLELNILDNNSSDSTREIIRKEYPEFNLIESGKNLGVWPGHEELMNHTRGEYIVAISVDIILDKNFVREAVKVLERDSKIGGVEAKIYSYALSDGKAVKSNTIDTCGFRIFRSRRIVNIGHGEKDKGLSFAKTSEGKAIFDFNNEQEIFAVEGAVPVFRKDALEDIRIEGHFADPDYFWYGDDLDLAWRMRLFGWKQVYSPKMIAYHDRKTTKSTSGNKAGFIAMRKTIPLFKRRLDWHNTTLTIIKNDFASNFLRDLPFILVRQFQLWAYFLFFEPAMFIELFNIAKLLPNVLKRRREIMRKVRISPDQMRRWIS